VVAGEDGDCGSVAGCCGRVCSLTQRGRSMGRLRKEEMAESVGMREGDQRWLVL
jgi:hypothetical protein